MAISTRNQNQIILKHLIDHGYITQLIATNYGVRRLASRNFDLKSEMVQIEVATKRDDTGTKYAYYSMTEFERNCEAGRMRNGYSYKCGADLKVA